MPVASDLLDRLAEVGAKVEASGNRLLVRAGPQPVPGELIRRLREAKDEILAALAPIGIKATATGPAPDGAELVRDPPWWRRHYLVRTINWELSGARSESRARSIAWGELEYRWHRLHGRRVPQWQCAGCGEPIGGLAALDLADSGRVHFDTLDCLLAFGERWRAEATAGLKALGLAPPDGIDQ